MATTGDTYHHGDLRRALMDGALAVIATDGLTGLSLRAVSAASGVSHAAPYHHFADKAALLRALGNEGLRLLDERMAAAELAAGEDPAARLVALGTAYVEFASGHPAYFTAMRAPEMRAAVPDHQEEHGEPWERLVRAAVACQERGLLAPGDPAVVAIGLWALVEGLSQLTLAGALGPVGGPGESAGPSANRVLVAMLPFMSPAPSGVGDRS